MRHFRRRSVSAETQSSVETTTSSGTTSTLPATRTTRGRSRGWWWRLVEVAPVSVRRPAARRRGDSVLPTRRCTCLSTCPPASGPLPNQHRTNHDYCPSSLINTEQLLTYIQTRWAKTHSLSRIAHRLLVFRPNGRTDKT